MDDKFCVVYGNPLVGYGAIGPLTEKEAGKLLEVSLEGAVG